MRRDDGQAMTKQETVKKTPQLLQSKVAVFGRHMCLLQKDELADLVMGADPHVGQGVRLVVTMNLDHVVTLQRSEKFRTAYDHAYTATIDGSPVALVAKMKGQDIPRITGTDLLVSMLDRLDPHRHRLFFVVSREETGARLQDYLNDRGFAPEGLAYVSPPFGVENDPKASLELAQKIKAHGTTHLIFGIGAPKSEIWIDQWREHLGDLYGFCFGSGPDFIVGLASRAPKLFQDLGAEWLWRLLTEPGRLWKRYLINSWPFFPAAWRELTRRP